MSETHPDMLCRHVAAIVTEYLDGQLEAAERAHLEQHLLICQACADFVTQTKLTVAGLEALACPQLPAAVRAGLLLEFRKRSGGTP